MNQAVANVHPRTERTIVWEQFGDLTKLSEEKPIDKVAVARRVAEGEPDFSVLELGSAVDRLVGCIQRHNS